MTIDFTGRVRKRQLADLRAQGVDPEAQRQEAASRALLGGLAAELPQPADPARTVAPGTVAELMEAIGRSNQVTDGRTRPNGNR